VTETLIFATGGAKRAHKEDAGGVQPALDTLVLLLLLVLMVSGGFKPADAASDGSEQAWNGDVSDRRIVLVSENNERQRTTSWICCGSEIANGQFRHRVGRR
jgi:hypothetical protein